MSLGLLVATCSEDRDDYPTPFTVTCGTPFPLNTCEMTSKYERRGNTDHGQLTAHTLSSGSFNKEVMVTTAGQTSLENHWPATTRRKPQ